MREPRRIWWARPRKLCVLERPGGGGRSHRPDRRAEEIEWLTQHGVRTVISTIRTRHNLAAYDEVGLPWFHVPVDAVEGAEDALDEVLGILRRQLRRGGAVALHGDRRTDFIAVAGAACMHDVYGVPVEAALARAVEAGLVVTPEAAGLVSVPL